MALNVKVFLVIPAQLSATDTEVLSKLLKEIEGNQQKLDIYFCQEDNLGAINSQNIYGGKTLIFKKLEKLKNRKDFKPDIDNEAQYYKWENQAFYANNPAELIYGDLASVVERREMYEAEQILLVLIGEKPDGRTYKTFIKEKNKQTVDYPIFISIDYVTNANEWNVWYKKQFPLKNILADTTRFARTNKMFIKHGRYSQIYQEKHTKYYWYLDVWHKDHYEVFDETGEFHLGEVDLNDKLIPNSIDSTKSIAYLI